jgi:spore coat polysaccharide biosynthesis protein SpsF
MKKGIFIQARLSSSRFPGKMLEKLDGIPLVEYVYNRCILSKEANQVIVITSIESSDDNLYKYCIDKDINVFRGSLDNVLERFIAAAKVYQCTLIGRVCGDSPFVDIDNLDNMFRECQKNKFDYVRYEQKVAGFLSEVVTLEALEKSYLNTKQIADVEHVTRYILENQKKFKVDIQREEMNIKSLTIDYPQDLLEVHEVLKALENQVINSININQYLCHV